MTDRRDALRATFARWLRVRARVRASANRLVAEEYALARDASRNTDPAMIVLLAHVRAQRASVDALAIGLDGRLAVVQAEIDAWDARFVSTLIAAASAR